MIRTRLETLTAVNGHMLSMPVKRVWERGAALAGPDATEAGRNL